MSTTTKTRSKFVWHDLMTPDPEASRRFYADLFGWKYQIEPHYTHIECAGRPMGGMVKMDPAHNIPSYWNGYVSVDNVDDSLVSVARLGGRVAVPAADIPNVGRFAVVGDPLSAHLSLFQSAKKMDDSADPAIVATQFCWDELLTRDPKKVTQFYTELFGWKPTGMDMGPMGTYWLFKLGDKDMAGMMQMPPNAEAPPFWLAYIMVSDVDATQKKAEELGGKTFVAPQDIPGVGRFSVLADSKGAAFALYKKS